LSPAKDYLLTRKRMTEKVEQNNYNWSIGFLDILALIFITLKLMGVITWSWWWVLSPILIQVGVMLFVFGGFLVFYLFAKRRLTDE
jgi:hypothetical protein